MFTKFKLQQPARPPCATFVEAGSVDRLRPRRFEDRFRCRSSAFVLNSSLSNQLILFCASHFCLVGRSPPERCAESAVLPTSATARFFQDCELRSKNRRGKGIGCCRTMGGRANSGMTFASCMRFSIFPLIYITCRFLCAHDKNTSKICVVALRQSGHSRLAVMIEEAQLSHAQT